MTSDSRTFAERGSYRRLEFSLQSLRLQALTSRGKRCSYPVHWAHFMSVGHSKTSMSQDSIIREDTDLQGTRLHRHDGHLQTTQVRAMSSQIRPYFLRNRRLALLRRASVPYRLNDYWPGLPMINLGLERVSCVVTGIAWNRMAGKMVAAAYLLKRAQSRNHNSKGMLKSNGQARARTGTR